MTVITEDKTLVRKLALAEARVRALEGEVNNLTAQMTREDLPSATSWLQQKVWRQRVSLRRLNRRVYAQRLVLRYLNAHGLAPTREQLDAWLEGVSDEDREAIWEMVAERE